MGSRYYILLQISFGKSQLIGVESAIKNTSCSGNSTKNLGITEYIANFTVAITTAIGNFFGIKGIVFV